MAMDLDLQDDIYAVDSKKKKKTHKYKKKKFKLIIYRGKFLKNTAFADIFNIT